MRCTSLSVPSAVCWLRSRSSWQTEDWTTQQRSEGPLKQHLLGNRLHRVFPEYISEVTHQLFVERKATGRA